ncbi:MAG: Zn-dependent membrane protease YugP [Candidatus Endobugula sp.]|jgi:Zn-dependent membrane protease YugP
MPATRQVLTACALTYVAGALADVYDCGDGLHLFASSMCNVIKETYHNESYFN